MHHDATRTELTPSDPLRRRVKDHGLVMELGVEGTGEGFWAYVGYTRELKLPAQGFKLHLSATVVNAVELFDRIVPLLVRRRIPFKCVSSSALLAHLNSGSYGMTQLGKFMTIYPSDDEAAVALAYELHGLTHDLNAPEIPSDFPLCAGSLVHYRFGVVSGHVRDENEPLVRDTYHLRLPDGGLVVDNRDPRTPVPEWVEDPFRAAAETRGQGRAPEVDNATLFANRFVIHQVLRQRGKGGVYRALEVASEFVRLSQAGADTSSLEPACGWTTRPVVIKEARRAGEMESSGTDAVARLHWQRQLLTELADDTRFPAVHEMFELDGHTYLVMEDVQGPSLAHWLTRNEPTHAQVLAWSRQLAGLVETLHAMGIAWCDISPDNVILTGKEQTLSASDLEHAVRADGPPFSGVGTPGYFPRELRGEQQHSLAARDLYGLGAVMHSLWSRGWYREQAASADRGYERMWRRPALDATCPPRLRSIIERAESIEAMPGEVLREVEPYRSIRELRADLARARIAS